MRNRDNSLMYNRKRIRGLDIVQAVREGVRTLNDIREKAGARPGGECRLLNPKGRCCSPNIPTILRHERSGSGDAPRSRS